MQRRRIQEWPGMSRLEGNIIASVEKARVALHAAKDWISDEIGETRLMANSPYSAQRHNEPLNQKAMNELSKALESVYEVIKLRGKRK